MCACTHVCVHMCTFMCLCVCVCVCAHVCAHACACVCVHAHTCMFSDLAMWGKDRMGAMFPGGTCLQKLHAIQYWPAQRKNTCHYFGQYSSAYVVCCQHANSSGLIDVLRVLAPLVLRISLTLCTYVLFVYVYMYVCVFVCVRVYAK